MDYGRVDLCDRLAADYVVGTLRGAARRRFETLLPSHPRLRDAWLAWQERLMPLSAALPAVTPPARVWTRIQARLDGLDNEAASTRPRFGTALGFWRAMTGFASVVAVVLAALLASPAPVPPPVVVVLSATPAAAEVGSSAGPAFVASISGDGRSLVTKPLVKVDLKSDRSLELWAIPPGGAPRSLGVIATGGATVVQKGKALEGADTLAVTIEPPGGSPTGKPTGPVIYAGKLTT